jgi:hypothetical protein
VEYIIPVRRSVNNHRCQGVVGLICAKISHSASFRSDDVASANPSNSRANDTNEESNINTLLRRCSRGTVDGSLRRRSHGTSGAGHARRTHNQNPEAKDGKERKIASRTA